MPKITFRTKLILFFIMTLIVQGVLISLFSYYYDKDIAIKNKQNDMVDSVNLTDININVRVRNIESLLVTASESSIINRLFSGEETEATKEYFQILESSLGVANHIVIKDGEQIRYHEIRDGENLETTTYEAHLSKPYEEAIRHPGKTVWLGVAESLGAENSEEDPVLMVSRAIEDKVTGKVLGAIVVEVDSATFSSLLLNSQNTFQMQYTFIVDQNGHIISENKDINRRWVHEINNTFDQGNRSFQLSWDNEDYLIRGQYNGITGWRTFTVISTEYIFPEVETLSTVIIFIIFLSTLCLSIVTAVIFYTMTRPIKDLTAAMGQVEEGDFRVHLETRRKDEIGNLVRAFNFMVEKINGLIQEVYKEKIAQKNAELAALQAQINPHFLYNTLDSINWMLIEKGEDQISDIIVSLGKLMKYSIQKTNGNVPLEEELSYVENYLLIQKNRLEDKLEYEICVPHDLRSIKVPKLILQPLVENAIIHGIEPLGRKGSIKITGERRGHDLVLSVSDDGRGIKEEELQEIKKNLLAMSEGDHTSIGLYNVAHRIELKYGIGYQLTIESQWNEGTFIEVRLPMSHYEGKR